MFGRKFGFGGPFMMEKLTPPFKMWFGFQLLYRPKVSVILVSVLILDLNQYGGFG